MTDQLAKDRAWIEGHIATGTRFVSGPRGRRDYRPVAWRLHDFPQPWGLTTIVIAMCEGETLKSMPAGAGLDPNRPAGPAPVDAVEKPVSELRRMTARPPS